MAFECYSHLQVSHSKPIQMNVFNIDNSYIGCIEVLGSAFGVDWGMLIIKCEQCLVCCNYMLMIYFVICCVLLPLCYQKELVELMCCNGAPEQGDPSEITLSSYHVC